MAYCVRKEGKGILREKKEEAINKKVGNN